MRWPRKNDPDSIRSRQEILGVDGLVTSIDLEPFAGAAEALDGRRRDPGLGVPGHDRAGLVRARPPTGALVETVSRRGDALRPARAHRGQPHALDDARLDRGRHRSARTCSPTGSPAPRASSARTRPRRSRSRAGSRPSCRRCATGSPASDDPIALAPRAPARGEDACRRPDVPRALGLDDRRRRRAEHDDPERLRAEHGLRDAARPGEARARLSSRRTWAATRSRRTSTSTRATARP